MSFGPMLLLDKSTLQGLSFDCIVILMRYYRHLISPILLRELTSDLAKEERGNTDQEMKKKIALLAQKLHYSHWMVLPDALNMVRGELLYEKNFIPMNGTQVPCETMTEVNTPKMGRGFFVDKHPMLAILRSWAGGNMPEEDLHKAKAIRDEDSSLDLVSLYQDVERETDAEAKAPKFRSLQEVIAYADQVRFFSKTPRQIILQIARYFFQDHTGHISNSRK